MPPLESLPPHLLVQASLMLLAPYKQPQPLPKPGRGYISSPLPPHVVFESFLYFRCRLWRGASPPDEAHDHQPLTHPAHAAPPLRPLGDRLHLHFPHRPHSPLPGAEAILSPHVPQAIFVQLSLQTPCLGRGRPEQQPGFLPGGRPQPSLCPHAPSPAPQDAISTGPHATPRGPSTLLSPFSFPVYLSGTRVHSQMRKYGTMLPQERHVRFLTLV